MTAPTATAGWIFSGTDAERLAFNSAYLYQVLLYVCTDTGEVWTYNGSWVKVGSGTGGGGAPTDATYVTFTVNAALSAEQVLGTAVIMMGTAAARPAAATSGRLYFVTDAGAQRWTRDNGTTWDDVAPDWSKVTGKPTTFAPIIGSGGGDAVAGNDARLTDARTPTAHKTSHQDGGTDEISLTGLAGESITPQPPKAHTHPESDVTNLATDLAAKEASANKGAASGYASLDAGTKVPIAQIPTGATSTTVPLGNDARLSDARTPTAHKASHVSGGGDAFAAGDDLVGNARGLRETGGPTQLTMGAVVDGELLKRSGTTITSQPAGQPAAHHTSHENGGADEVSVAGLSGELADPQPPKITALPAVVTPAGTDVFPVDQGGTLKNETLAQVATYDRGSFVDLIRKNALNYTDFLGAAGAIAQEAVVPWDIVLLSSGTMAKIAGLASHPGILRISSSTTANSGGYVATDPTAYILAGGEVFEIIFQPKVASNTATTMRFGFFDTVTSADAVDGAYFELPAGSFALVGKTSNNSTRTTSATIATLSVNTWYRLRITVNANATSITFEAFNMAGTSLGSQAIATNIPTAAGREMGMGLIVTNSGTSAVLLAWFDFMAMWYNADLTR